MQRSNILQSLFFLCAATASALRTTPCPLIGSDVTAPVHPSRDNAISDAILTAKSWIAEALNDTAISSNSFSLDVFSQHEETSLFTYHHTASGLGNDTNGTARFIDSDSIYRIGSISKLFTAYTYLVAIGDRSWNDPVTKYVPELAEYADTADLADDAEYFDWNDITVGELAAHVSGLQRDLPVSLEADESFANVTGLPLTPPPEGAFFCGEEGFPVPCGRDSFFNLMLPTRPAYPGIAVYSNIGWTLMSYVLENITSTAYSDLLTSKILNPLNLNSTFYTLPSLSRCSLSPKV